MPTKVEIIELLAALSMEAATSVDETIQLLVRNGLTEKEAHRALQFIQAAWGRAALSHLGIQFSPEFLEFDKAGKVSNSGLLSDEPWFSAALENAQRLWSSKAVQAIALTSAEFNALNKALHAGSKPENLVSAPVGLFCENPLLVALERANRTIEERLRASYAAGAAKASPPKPWWKFW